LSEKRRIVTNTLANGASQLASMLSALIFMPWLISRFGLADFGLYMLASSVGAYATLLDFGVGATLVKMIAEKSAVDDRDSVGELISNALAFYLIIGLLASATMLVVGANAETLFNVSADSARLLRNLMFVAAGSSLWAWPVSTAGYVLAGRQRYTLSARVGIVATLANIVVTAAVVLLHQGPLALMLGTTAVGVAAGIVVVALARRELKGIRVAVGRVSRGALTTIFRFSWTIFVVQLCTVVIYQQTDRIVLAVFVGASAIALYEAAGKFQGFVTQIVGFANSAVLPMASHLDSQGRDSAIRTLFLRGTKYTLALVTPVVVVLIVLARPLLQHWLGDSFAAQALAAQIMVSHQLLTAGTYLGDNMIVGMGKLSKRLPFAVAFALANLLLSLALVRSFGILGVVLGTVIPYYIDYPIHMRQLLRWLDVPTRRWLREVVLPTYPLLVIPLVICVFALGTPLAGSLLGIAGTGTVAVALYWLALIAVGLSSTEKAELMAALRAARSRTGR
jgi:O-antigen/teichoic acid export membrane protein